MAMNGEIGDRIVNGIGTGGREGPISPFLATERYVRSRSKRANLMQRESAAHK